MRSTRWSLMTALMALVLFGTGCPAGPGPGDGGDPVPDAADHFFVDVARGIDTATGSRDAPLLTIQEAIDRARPFGGSVFVGGGGNGGGGRRGTGQDQG